MAAATTTDFELLAPPAAPTARRAAAFAGLVWRSTWPKVLAIAIVIAAWQIEVWSGWKKQYVIPSPFTVFDQMFHDAHQLNSAGLLTLEHGAQGFLLSMIIGGIVGIAVARVRVLRAAIGSMITGLQTMPSVAWVPLAIILFHEGPGLIMFVVVLGAAPSIANGIIQGIDHVPPVLLRAGRVLGARGFGALRHIVIPAALPSVVGGLKQGWAFAWRSLMAAEIIAPVAGHLGVGALLNAASSQSDYIGVFEAMIVILIIGILIDSLVFGTIDRAIRRRYGLIDAASG